MAVETQRETLTIEEAAKRLGISRNSAYNLAARGELPGAIRLGKRIVVSIYQFERFLHGENDGNKGDNV
jgi:excisionase family DNA binding protein